MPFPLARKHQNLTCMNGIVCETNFDLTIENKSSSKGLFHSNRVLDLVDRLKNGWKEIECGLNWKSVIIFDVNFVENRGKNIQLV